MEVMRCEGHNVTGFMMPWPPPRTWKANKSSSMSPCANWLAAGISLISYSVSLLVNIKMHLYDVWSRRTENHPLLAADENA